MMWLIFTASENIGILFMAHGGSEEWNNAVKELVSVIDEYPTSIAFGMANPKTLQRAIDELEKRGVDKIIIFRLFISPYSFLKRTEELIKDKLKTKSKIYICNKALMNEEVSGRILLDRVKSLSKEPKNEVVLIIAHGDGDDEIDKKWKIAIGKLTRNIENLGFHDVRVETLREDWKDKRAEAERKIRNYVKYHSSAGRKVIVIPFRLYGFGPYAEVLKGLNYIADGKGLLPHPALKDWLRGKVEECLNEAQL